MASKEEARSLYNKDLNAGYSREQARERLGHFAQTGIALPDPTEKYWPALIGQESGGDQNAVSSKGATGVAQVMPDTGPEAAALAGLPWDPIAFKNDAVYNAKLGRAYFRKQMADNGNDPAKALAAYNAGPGALRKAGGDLSKLPAETQNYVPSIMNKADQGMQPDLDSPEAVAQAKEALMTPRDRARKVYEDVLANGGSREDAKAAIAQLAAPQQAPVAQQAPPAALTMGASTPAASPPEDPMVQKIQDPVARQEEMLQGNGFDRFKAGFERSLGGMDRGARKALGQLTGQDAGVARAEAEEQGIRNAYDKYDPAGSGPSLADAGKLTGDVAGAATIGKALPGGIVGGAVAGGIQGGLQPTVKGESQLTNAGVGSALGGTANAVGKGLTAALGKFDPTRAAAAANLRGQGVEVPVGQEYNSPMSAALRKMSGEKGAGPIPEKSLTATLAKAMGMQGEDITNSSLEANLRRSGKAIGDAHMNSVATADRAFRNEALRVGSDYLLTGPIKPGDETMSMIEHIVALARPGNKISGKEYQALRTGLTADSVTGSAANKQAMGDLKRAMDKLFAQQNPKPELPGLRSDYRLSKILRKGSGVPAEGMTAKQLRNRIEGAADKGEVNSKVRDLLSDTNKLLPAVKVGGDAAAGAGDEVVIRGLDRPGLISGLMAVTRGASGPASKFYDKGLIQKVINDPAARASLANLLRGGVIPPATPKGE